jgi:4-hydroxythreonine-4-phosphate dehydrogenase
MITGLPIAISCGEPAGIGPEIAVKAWETLKSEIPVIWVGDPRHLPAGTNWKSVTSGAEAAAVSAEILPVLAQDFGSGVTAGAPAPSHAQGVIDAIAEGVTRVSTGECAGICTAPIHKAALIDGADFAYPGHTEYLAALAGVDRVVMMLACDALRVVPTTIHIPIAEVPRQLTASLLTDTLLITHAALRRDFGIAAPQIAVAGLNPHAGEDGKMGGEEIEMITPVLDALRSEGMQITGPHSADTLFHAGARAQYDVAVCMYHDQALIPIKTLDFSGGVNVTLGLPFIRTSPDHGTAFDIAGKGIADATSMIAAIRMAATMAQARG